MTGRPLRFLGLVMASWIAGRVLILWHETGSVPEAIRRAVSLVAERSPPDVAVLTSVRPARHPSNIDRRMLAARPLPLRHPHRSADPRRVQLALLAMSQFGPVEELVEPAAQQSGFQPQLQHDSPALAAVVARQGRRWSASSWLIARGGTGIGASAGAPQLGGAQAGLRVDYRVGRGFAATGRVASPAAGAGRELALGIAWSPANLPLRLVAERRLALDRGRGGAALGVSGGVYTALPADFRLEGYAQGGVIFRDGSERYVDGIARVARPVAELGKLDLDLGLGAWGGAQRGVARLDVGPSIGVSAPLADRTVRISLDWRQRIAGRARPGSGPALSVGSDF